MGDFIKLYPSVVNEHSNIAMESNIAMGHGFHSDVRLLEGIPNNWSFHDFSHDFLNFSHDFYDFIAKELHL